MNTVKTVEKALKIMLTLTAHDEGMGVSELSGELNISMSAVSRLLGTLRKYDFVQYHPVIKKYMLGKAAQDIGRSYQSHIVFQLVSLLEPYIKALRDKVKETVVLEAMIGNEVILICRVNGPNVVGILVKVGTKVPIHASPGAKAILAFCPVSMVNRLLNEEMTRFTSQTITDPRVLKSGFKKIRKEGVAFSYGEYYSDINAVAAPIFNQDKAPIAAIVIPIPVYRAELHQESKLVFHLKETAEKISKQLAQYGIKGQLKF